MASAADVDDDNEWESDKLYSLCQGASTSYDLALEGDGTPVLYRILQSRPDLYFEYNSPTSGAFYCGFGCNNCNLKTPHYQPQYMTNKFDAQGLTNKGLKQNPYVRQAFRTFICEILEQDPETMRQMCRFRNI